MFVKTLKHVIILTGKGDLMNMPVTVNKDLCIGCAACLASCPVEALELDDNGLAECNEDACIDCGACVADCPVQAISQE